MIFITFLSESLYNVLLSNNFPNPFKIILDNQQYIWKIQLCDTNYLNGKSDLKYILLSDVNLLLKLFNHVTSIIVSSLSDLHIINKEFSQLTRFSILNYFDNLEEDNIKYIVDSLPNIPNIKLYCTNKNKIQSLDFLKRVNDTTYRLFRPHLQIKIKDS